MFYWLPSFRTMLPWLIAIGLAWFTIKNPHRAAADVQGIGRFIGFCFSRLLQFVDSL